MMVTRLAWEVEVTDDMFVKHAFDTATYAASKKARTVYDYTVVINGVGFDLKDLVKFLDGVAYNEGLYWDDRLGTGKLLTELGVLLTCGGRDYRAVAGPNFVPFREKVTAELKRIRE